MGRKTDGERIDELQEKVGELAKVDAVLTQRLDTAERSLDELYDAQRESDHRAAQIERVFADKLAALQREADKQIAELRLEHEKQLAELRRSHEAETRLLKQQVEDQKQELLRWGARLWQVAIGTAVVVVGAALVTYLGLKK